MQCMGGGKKKTLRTYIHTYIHTTSLNISIQDHEPLPAAGRDPPEILLIRNHGWFSYITIAELQLPSNSSYVR